MNLKRLLLILFSLCEITYGYAGEIKGKIVDVDRNPMPGVSVSLISFPDSVVKSMKVTDTDGDFLFEKINPGKYQLNLSMIGMENLSKNVEIKDSAEKVQLGNLILNENAILLKETIVTGVRPAIITKQDTIEYNADSYHTAPNATVDQLLKKLPGLEVGSDGSITSNGKTVSKILIDGKEFFADDPQMASKNLPSNMIDKVQVIDRKSDLARLTGIEDGEEETVINLKVKKDMNNGWFGNVSAGYGFDDKYNGSFVINNFHNGNQITLLGGLNNINENGFSDRGRSRFRDFGGSGGITTSQRLGLNFNIGKEEIIRFGGNILYSHSDRKASNLSDTQFLFPDSVSYQHSETFSNDKGHNLNIDLRLQWNIDDNNTLDFRPRFSMNFRNTVKNDSSTLNAGDDFFSLVNKNLNFQENRGKNFETSGNLIFNHKFKSKPGRAFSFNLQYAFSSTLQKSLTWSDILFYLVNDQDEEILRFLDNKNYSNSVEGRLTWTEPLGDVKNGNFLALSYRAKYQWTNADLLTYKLPFQPGYLPDFNEYLNCLPPDAELNIDLSNRFRNKFSTQELQVGYKKVNKNINLEAGILFAPSGSQSEDLIDETRNLPARWVWNVAPYANIRVKFNSTSSLRANYRTRTNLPSMSQLQPVPDVSDPLNIKIGNPELKPTFNQNFGINFNNFNAERQQSLMLMINASYALNSVVTRTFANPETGGRTTTYTNVNGNANLMFMGMFATPITKSKWRTNVRFNSRFSTVPGYINGDYNRSSSLSLSPSAGITFSSEVFQGSFNPNYSFNSIKNSLPQQSDRKTYSYGFSADASLFLPFGIDLTTDLYFAKNSGYSSGYNISQWLWNAQISYSFLGDKSLTFSAKAYDILHQKKNISRSVSANAIVDSEYNDLTRYVLFSITWTFNSLKKKNKTTDESFFPEGPPSLPPDAPVPPPGGNRERIPSGSFQPSPPGRPF